MKHRLFRSKWNVLESRVFRSIVSDYNAQPSFDYVHLPYLGVQKARHCSAIITDCIPGFHILSIGLMAEGFHTAAISDSSALASPYVFFS